MAQVGTSNYPIPNDTGANFRADVNENLTDLYSTSSGSSAPPAAIEGQLWINTSNTPDTLECKTASGWVVLGQIAQNFGLSTADTPTFTGGLNLPAGSSSSLALRRSDDTDTGIYFSATNTLAIQAGGTESHDFTSTYSTAKVPLRVPGGTATAPSITKSGDENTGLTWNAADELSVTTGGTRRTSVDSSGLWVRDQKEVRLLDADNTHFVGLKAPGTVAANVTLTLPSDDGNNGDVLKSDGSGNLSWAAASTLVTDVSGAVVTVIESSSTFTPATGRTYFEVWCIGGGGGSGSTHSNLDDSHKWGRSGAGGTGAVAIRTYNATEMGANAAITVGAGGAAGTGGGGGTAGGDTICNPAGSGATLTGGGGGGSGAAGQNSSSGGGSAGTTTNAVLGWEGNAGYSGGSTPTGEGATGSVVKGYWSANTYGQGGAGRCGSDDHWVTGSAGSAGAVVIYQW